jgi:AcrR family transcriptional regulator
MATASATRATPDRLVAAATELFARQGFHGTSIRDIAERANANVASGHYHYGSKEGLYREVLRAQFARVRHTLDARGVRASPSTLRRASRKRLTTLLEARILAVLDVLLGPPPGPHGILMLREMCDPSMALPLIVGEFIRPQLDDMEALLAALAPDLDADALRLIAFSIFGQILFYRFNMPVALLLLELPSYPKGFTRHMARHITRFSLAGLDGAYGRTPRAR